MIYCFYPASSIPALGQLLLYPFLYLQLLLTLIDFSLQFVLTKWLSHYLFTYGETAAWLLTISAFFVFQQGLHFNFSQFCASSCLVSWWFCLRLDNSLKRTKCKGYHFIKDKKTLQCTICFSAYNSLQILGLVFGFLMYYSQSRRSPLHYLILKQSQ